MQKCLCDPAGAASSGLCFPLRYKRNPLEVKCLQLCKLTRLVLSQWNSIICFYIQFFEYFCGCKSKVLHLKNYQNFKGA